VWRDGYLVHIFRARGRYEEPKILVVEDEKGNSREARSPSAVKCYRGVAGGAMAGSHFLDSFIRRQRPTLIILDLVDAAD